MAGLGAGGEHHDGLHHLGQPTGSLYLGEGGGGAQGVHPSQHPLQPRDLLLQHPFLPPECRQLLLHPVLVPPHVGAAHPELPGVLVGVHGPGHAHRHEPRGEGQGQGVGGRQGAQGGQGGGEPGNQGPGGQVKQRATGNKRQGKKGSVYKIRAKGSDRQIH